MRPATPWPHMRQGVSSARGTQVAFSWREGTATAPHSPLPLPAVRPETASTSRFPATVRELAPHSHQQRRAASGGVLTESLHVVAVRVPHEGGVVAVVVLRPHLRLVQNRCPLGHGRGVEGVDRVTVGRREA